LSDHVFGSEEGRRVTPSGRGNWGNSRTGFLPSTALFDGKGSDCEGVGIGIVGCFDDDASLALEFGPAGLGLGEAEYRRRIGIGCS
jgi:hypothetical protein